MNVGRVYYVFFIVNHLECEVLPNIIEIQSIGVKTDDRSPLGRTRISFSITSGASTSTDRSSNANGQINNNSRHI